MKRVAKILLVLVVVVVLLLVSVPLWIDSAARTAVEEGGTYAMGVTTRVDSVTIGIFGGECTIEGLHIDNPEGFETPHFLELGGGHAAVAFGTVMEDKVVLPTLTLEDVSVNLDRAGKKSNYGVIMENLKKLESGEKDEKGKTFVIEKVVIRNVHVNAKLSIAGILKPTVPLVIDRIELENVGEGGIAMSQVFAIVMKGLLGGILEAGAGVLPNEITSGLKGGLEVLGDIGGSGLKVIGKGGEAIAGTGKKIVDGVGDAIGGLFGKKKRKDQGKKD